MNVTRLMLSLRRAMSMLLSGSRKPEAGRRRIGLIAAAVLLATVTVAAVSRGATGKPPHRRRSHSGRVLTPNVQPTAATPAWRNAVADGALADGSGDDSGHIETSIGKAAVLAPSAATQENVVYLQPGTYLLTHAMSMPTFNVQINNTATVTVSPTTGLLVGQQVRITDGNGTGVDCVTVITQVNSGSITVSPAPTNTLASTPMNIVIDNITLKGDGPATRLLVSGSHDAIDLTGIISHFRVENLSIVLSGTSPQTSGYAINVTGTSAVHSDNISIRDVFIENTWGGVNWQYSDSGETSNVTLYQTQMETSPSVTSFTQKPFVMQGCRTQLVHALTAVALVGWFGSNGVDIDSDTDTVTIDNCRVTGAGIGLPDFYLHNSLGTGHTGPRLTHLTDCYAEGAGALLGGPSSTGYGDGYYITSARDVRLERCHAAINAGNGFEISGVTSVTGIQGVNLVSCDSEQNGRHGYFIYPGASSGSPVNITLAECTGANNSFYRTNGKTDGTTGTTTGVTVDSILGMSVNDTITLTGVASGGGDLTTTITAINTGTKDLTLHDSAVAGTATTVTDPLTLFDGAQIYTYAQNVRVVNCRFGNFIYTLGLQRYGLNIGASTDYLGVIGNDLTGNQTGGLNSSSTGTHNQVANNIQ